MGRAIVTRADVEAAGRLESAAEEAKPTAPDGYLQKLMKYLPAEVIALYLAVEKAVDGLGTGRQQQVGAVLVFTVFLGGLGFWLKKDGVTSRTQILISTGAFVVWILATSGGPFAAFGAGEVARQWGAVLVPLFTFATAAVDP